MSASSNTPDEYASFSTALDPADKTGVTNLVDPERTGILVSPAYARRDSTAESRNRLPDLGSRYRVIRKLGQGGMGAVFLGEEASSGRRVAIKILSLEFTADEQAIQRFRKETRLLSEVRHPNVANLLDTGVVGGIQFLVMELVEGIDLKTLLQTAGALPERMALQIIADIAHALSAAHASGIIHRDIKPGNILLSVISDTQEDPAAAVVRSVDNGQVPSVKLTDFGLARHIDQGASLELTRTGMMLGTPYYISPEQCAGKDAITPAADVYSLAATLFELLTGVPPFRSDDPVKLIGMHCFETAPDPRKLNPEVSDGAAELLAKALQKSPLARHADAGHFLDDLTRLLSGDVSSAAARPALPQSSGKIFEACWQWKLSSSPSELWSYVSNTERINASLGLPAVEYETRRDSHGIRRRFGSFRLGWTRLCWEEHPFEWVEGRQFSILREFENGPFQWFISTVKMTPEPGGGCQLQHNVKIATRGWVGRLLAHIEVNLKGRKPLDRVYRRIDDVISGRLSATHAIDPFVQNASAPGSLRKKISTLRAQLVSKGLDHDCLDSLLDYLMQSPAQELARLRPRALARKMNLDASKLTHVCLEACHAGLLELHWDVVCPTCRVAATVKDSLTEIDRHEHCEACDQKFDVEFSSSVELIFRVHPGFRQADLKTYCLGGPEHAPHVVAQVRLRAHEKCELDLSLDPGAYLIRGNQLPYTVRIVSESLNGTGRANISLDPDAGSQRPQRVHSGRQLITLHNAYDHPIVVRLERTTPRSDVLTATEALQLPDFCRLFPKENLTRDRLSSMSTCTLLAMRIANTLELFSTLGEAGTADSLRCAMSMVRSVIESNGGQVIKEQDDRVLAVFPLTPGSLEAALKITGCTGQSESSSTPQMQAALHRGTAMSTSFNGRLDYFGRSVTLVSAMLEAAGSQTLIVSREIVDDEDCHKLLTAAGRSLIPHSKNGGLQCFCVKSVAEVCSVLSNGSE